MSASCCLNFPVWNNVLFFGLLCAVMVSVVKPDKVNCYMKGDTLLQQKACFEREGIAISLPSTTLKTNKKQRKTDILNSLIENEPDMLCRQKEEFKRALPCVMDHARQCMPTDYKGYLPDPEFMTKTMDKLCDNKTDIDFTCVKDMAERLFDCTIRKGKSAFQGFKGEISAKDVLCKAFELHIACQKEVFPQCGCDTTRIYTDIYLDYIYPPACPPIGHIHNHVICKVTSSLHNQHDNDGMKGSGSKPPASWWFVGMLGLAHVLGALFNPSIFRSIYY